MMNEIIKEFPIANIARVEVITEEETPKTYVLDDVASEAEAVAYLSEGEEEELRIKNTIKAQNNTEDIVLGYDIMLLSATLVPEILALVDGGKLVYDETDTDKVIAYDAPVIGKAVDRTPFTTNIYTEEKDGDGSTKSYIMFSYRNCKGEPVNYELEEGEFFVPELNIKSRSKLGQSPVGLRFLEELPE